MGRAKRTELDAPVGWVEGKAWDHSLLSWGEEVHARNGANRLIAKFAAEWHGRQAAGRRRVAFAASAARAAEAVCRALSVAGRDLWSSVPLPRSCTAQHGRDGEEEPVERM